MSTAQDRDLNHLHQSFRTRLENWLTAVKAAGLGVMVIETARTAERQAYLYAQGRTRPGNVVTWTMDSCHRYATAADVCPLVNGQISWDIADYQRMHIAAPPATFGLELVRNNQGQIMEWPHLQLIGGQDAALKLGIVRDVPQSSIWPLPVTTPVPVPAKPPKRLMTRVTLVDDAGNDVLLTDARAIYGGVLIENSDTGVRLTKPRKEVK